MGDTLMQLFPPNRGLLHEEQRAATPWLWEAAWKISFSYSLVGGKNTVVRPEVT